MIHDSLRWHWNNEIKPIKAMCRYHYDGNSQLEI